MSDTQRFDTQAVHAGESRDAQAGLTTPIQRSAPFIYETIEELDAHAAGTVTRYEYARTSNPTTRVAELKLAALEGAEDAIVTASGMAAITCTYLALLSAGDHVLVGDDGYKRSLTFARDVLPRYGITGEWISAAQSLAAATGAIRDNTRLVLVEAPSNPHTYLPDIAGLAKVCHDAGALLAVDATLASPANLQPLALGADLVIHSATKYLAGHNDLLAGVIAGRAEQIARIRDFHINLGSTLDPEGAYLLIRSLKTLPIRVARQNATAQAVAAWLDARPEVNRVYHPSRPSHPHHALAARDLRGYGGTMSFDLEADLSGVSRFIAALRVISHGTSLGGVESLCLHMWSMMHRGLAEEDRQRLGIEPTMVRLSVGLEDAEDLEADLERALGAMRG